jgi:hypothetical protein
MKSFHDLWKEISAETPGTSGIMRRRISMGNGVDVFIGRIIPDERPAVLLEVKTGAITPDMPHSSCSGFTLTANPGGPGQQDQVSLILALAETRFKDVFFALADDVLYTLCNAATEQIAVKNFVKRISHWREFFQQHKIAGLTESEQIGLFGELLVIKDVLLPDVQPDFVLSGWQGPDGANQDFNYRRCAIEVKTTKSNPHEKIHVSNLLQLDDTGLPALFLIHLALDQRRGSGKTLPELISDIRTYLESSSPDAMIRFNTQLVKSKYLDAHGDLYTEHGYNLRHLKAYHVNGAFPRLRENDIPSGVGDVEYSIMISSGNDHETELKRVVHLVKEE